MVAAISKIKEAEDLSEAAVRKATESAQEIVRAAAVTSRDRRKAILDEARKKRAEALEKARKEADEACVPLEEANRRDLDKILNPDETAFTQAVDALVASLAQGS